MTKLQVVFPLFLVGCFFGNYMYMMAFFSISSPPTEATLSYHNFAFQSNQFTNQHNARDSGINDGKYSGLTIGETIIRKTFDQTYGKLMATHCPKTKMARTCYQNFLQDQSNATLSSSNRNGNQIVRSNDNEEDPAALPWWFRTLLAESAIVASEWWQMLCTKGNPHLRQCQLPKVGSKQWSKFMHLMNEEGWKHADDKIFKYSWNYRGRNWKGPKFVVLRDPLERYLSGFLDKCVGSNVWQGHCEPKAVFTDGSYDPEKNSIKDIKSDQRVLFDAFVHTSPLKWNVHFMPQALLCDGLYRTINEYDYILRMGPLFHMDMSKLASVHPRVDDTLVKLFDYKNKWKEEVLNAQSFRSGGVAGGGNVSGIKGSGTSDQVSKFYTPATVRKVLEYMAIDYVVLNLTVPIWAEEILLKEEEERRR